MMTTLAMYAVSAALYAAAPSDQGYDPAHGGAPGADPAGVQMEQQGVTDSDTRGDPSQALARARRPAPRGDSASQRALSSTRGADPARAEAGPTDDGLRQQDIWTTQ